MKYLLAFQVGGYQNGRYVSGDVVVAESYDDALIAAKELEKRHYGTTLVDLKLLGALTAVSAKVKNEDLLATKVDAWPAYKTFEQEFDEVVAPLPAEAKAVYIAAGRKMLDSGFKQKDVLEMLRQMYWTALEVNGVPTDDSGGS